MSIFPEGIEEINEIENNINKIDKLKTYKEYAIDETGKFLYDDMGKNIIVEKNEALKIWIFKTLQTERNRYIIYSSNYGNDFEQIIGKGYNKNLVTAELERLIEECLLANPYIKSIENVELDFEGSKLHINVKVKTIYGEVETNVR